MKKATIVAFIFLLPILGCGRDKGEIPITRPSSSSGRAGSATIPTALADDIKALLERFDEVNSRYKDAEIGKEERTQTAVGMEKEAWRLVRGAKAVAESDWSDHGDVKEAAFDQELAVFLLLYCENLHAALCSERMNLQTDKDDWNQRARLYASRLGPLANSIRFLSDNGISLPSLSPPPGRLPTPISNGD